MVFLGRVRLQRRLIFNVLVGSESLAWRTMENPVWPFDDLSMRPAGRHPGGARDDGRDSCETENMREVTKLATVEKFLRLEAEEISVFTFDFRRA